MQHVAQVLKLQPRLFARSQPSTRRRTNRVLLIESSRGHLNTGTFLALQKHINIDGWATDYDSGLRMAIRLRPDLLVLHWSEGARHVLGVLRLLHEVRHPTTVVVVVDNPSLRTEAAACAGVDAVLVTEECDYALHPTISGLLGGTC